MTLHDVGKDEGENLRNDAPLRENIAVSLVDGDSDIRHARQLMLRSERFDVRSYATWAALLADPRSRDNRCIVVDIATPGLDALGLLRRMRAGGWRGKAILLDRVDSEGELAQEAARNGDAVFDRDIGDRPLVAAIAASVGRMPPCDPA